jgi:iron complex outermembrane receptor protein
MNYEAGISQSLFKKKISIEFTGFMVKGDNLIVTGEMGKLFNTGEIDNKGIEIAIQANPSNDFNINTAYSYIHMKTPVYATPENQLYISGQYRLNKLTIMAGLHHVSGLDTDVSAKINTRENYTLFNAMAIYQVWKYLSLFVNGENLLDQTYENNRFYTMPGATVFGGISFKM